MDVGSDSQIGDYDVNHIQIYRDGETYAFTFRNDMIDGILDTLERFEKDPSLSFNPTDTYNILLCLDELRQ